jgi:hypothetical protein
MPGIFLICLLALCVQTLPIKGKAEEGVSPSTAFAPIASSASIEGTNLSGEEGAKPSIETSHVLLQGLDKVTARVLTIEAAINEDVMFGTLQIKVLKCLKTPPEDPPESVAFLEIREEKPLTPMYTVFKGWMFASNPSLSAPEHPVYDVWVKECIDKVSTTATGSEIPADPAKKTDASSSVAATQPSINPEDIEEEAPLSDPVPFAPE